MRPLFDGRHRTPLIISRRTHPLVKEIRSVRDNPVADRIFLEGPRLVEEALKASLPIHALVVSAAYQDGQDFLGKVKRFAKQTVEVSNTVFDALSDVKEPQGILAIVGRPRWTWEQLLQRRPAPLVILDGLQNPGNVASIVRTAEAAGAAGIMTTPATAHLFSPKALRGAMGSSLRLPSVEHLPPLEIAKRLDQSGYRLWGASLARAQGPAADSYTEVDWTSPCAILLGQEGGGLSEAWDAYPHRRVHIPMRAPVDSLNVAAAAAILLYEAYRQSQVSA